MNKEITETSLIVWEGVITRWGVIEPIVNDKTEVRLANDDEAIRYLSRP